MFSVSTEMLVFVAVFTTVLSALVLTGQTARFGLWFEDFSHRFGESGD